MRILFAFFFLAASTAFRPMAAPKHSTTKLEAVSRRDWLAAAVLLAAPQAAGAVSHAIQNREGSHTHGSTWFFDENIEMVREEAQMPTGNKLDLNNAAVSEFKVFPGMYPHAAGQVASHGPYNSVADIFKIKTLTDNDVKVLKKYESYFTVNPPGRMFDERINERVST